MKTELLQIELTKAQIDSADWLLGCPVFGETAEDIAHGWDETPENAARIVAAAAECKREGNTLTLTSDREILEYLHDYAENLADMSAKEYIDDLLVQGFDHRQAQCKANAAVRSVESLANKIAAYL
jgi:hypothetical protein